MSRPASDNDLERLLSRTMRSREAVGGEACPDPELLAAFVDGVLHGVERDRIERHAASCSGCAQTLAAAVASEQPVAHPGRATGWSGWRMLRWAVPLATAVVVAGVWFVTPGLDDRSAPAMSSGSPASDPAAASPRLSDAAPGADTKSERESPTASEGARRLEKPDPPLHEYRTASQDKRADVQARKESADPADAATASQSDRGLLRLQRADVAFGEVRTSDPGIVWRSRGSSIERSTNGGGTWTVEYTAPRTLAGGSAAAPDVVWFFATEGLILRGVQGTWTQSSAPAAVTIVSLRATTATRATITLADGRVLETNDGGLSWTAR